jgi:hypothetical protein
MESLETPKVDVKEIQAAANAAAKKAYLIEIDNYYTSYESPYKKLIRAELQKQEFKYNMELPHILDKINSALAEEVDAIANRAIASTYIPKVSEILVSIDKKQKMSEILKMIIQEIEPERDVFDEFHFSYEKDNNHGWLSCEMGTPDSYYEFTLHTVSAHKKNADDVDRYQLLSFPYNKYKTGYNSKMIVYKDDIKIEMPFTPNILQDKVLGVFFKVMLAGCFIEMDVRGFDEDMFPEEENCHC